MYCTMPILKFLIKKMESSADDPFADQQVFAKLKWLLYRMLIHHQPGIEMFTSLPKRDVWNTSPTFHFPVRALQAFCSSSFREQHPKDNEVWHNTTPSPDFLFSIVHENVRSSDAPGAVVNNYRSFFIGGKTRLRLPAYCRWIFASSQQFQDRCIAECIRRDKYEFLVCCEKSSLKSFARYEDQTKRSIFAHPEAVYEVLGARQLTRKILLVRVRMLPESEWMLNAEWEHSDETMLTEENRKLIHHSGEEMQFLPV